MGVGLVLIPTKEGQMKKASISVSRTAAGSFEPSARAERTYRWGRALVPYTFVLPAGLFLLAMVGYPVFFNVRMSFQDLKAINLLSGTAPFVGLANYQEIFADPIFLQVVRNTLIFTAGSLVFQVSIGLALALFYNRTFPGSVAMRGLYLIAWTIPVLVVGAVFRWMLDGQVGLINWALRGLGLLEGDVFWLSDPNLALGAVTFINIWLGVPFNMALLLAGLQGIPNELYEAADIDGAGRAAKFWRITLPILRPALFAVGLLGLIYTFKVFDLIYVTTSGGPVNSTHVLSTRAYEMVFGQFSFGPGAAVLNVLFVVLFVVSLLYLWNIRHEEAAA